MSETTTENDFESLLSGVQSTLEESSREDYYMPAEWEEHSACLILWPHNSDTFRLSKVSKEIANLALRIATTGQEAVHLLCKDAQSAEKATEAIRSCWSEEWPTMIYTCICPSNDTWARDTGPTFVLKRKPSAEGEQKLLIGLDWDFNAYGGPEEGCYWPCTEDRKIAGLVCCSRNSPLLKGVPNDTISNAIPTSIAQSLSIHSSLPIPMILEGGSFHTDGQGTLLTTCECLLNPNRNPHLTQDQIEGVLKLSLGIQKVLWLPYGLDNDVDTNGHVDNFCCFAKPAHVVLAWTDRKDESDENGNYQRCRAAHEYLQSTTDAQGRTIEITKLYLPEQPLRYTHEEAMSIGKPTDEKSSQNEESMAFVREAGEIMAASYINFYIANKAILVPQFAASSNDPDLEATDQKALETLRPLFPDRTVVGIPSREILLGGGNIHCQTQQVPSV